MKKENKQKIASVNLISQTWNPCALYHLKAATDTFTRNIISREESAESTDKIT